MSPDSDRPRRGPARIRPFMMAGLNAITLMIALAVLASPSLVAASAAQPPRPAKISPPPEPEPQPEDSGSSGGPPCRTALCRKILEQVCKQIDCTKLSREFRETSRSSRYARRQLKGDRAFKGRFKGKGFEAHHIVAKGPGLSDFAQALLRRVGIKADDVDNLAALRGFSRLRGKPGFKQLAKDKLLRDRAAHADTFFKYYYQTVNERFAELVDRLGRLPEEAEVRTLLKELKAELYKGGKGLIKPGRSPRSISSAVRPPVGAML